ncbi:MAG: hypothetical protein O3A94_07155 [Proteobacteria bacterium]|nr:hypothetical protein [Pseudomonadota bacterium]
MAAFDPFAGQTYSGNDCVSETGENTVDVINSKTLVTVLPDWRHPYPDRWFHPGSG